MLVAKDRIDELLYTTSKTMRFYSSNISIGFVVRNVPGRIKCSGMCWKGFP